MKIVRQVLIDTIDQATRDYDERWAVWNGALTAWHQQQYDKWLAERTEAWREVRDYLTKRLRDGRPILHEEIAGILGPSASRYGQPIYESCWHRPSAPSEIRVDGKVVKPPVMIPGYSHALRKTLDAIDEPHVSDHQLKQLGFNNLEQLFRAAVQNGAAVGVTQ